MNTHSEWQDIPFDKRIDSFGNLCLVSFCGKILVFGGLSSSYNTYLINEEGSQLNDISRRFTKENAIWESAIVVNQRVYALGEAVVAGRKEVVVAAFHNTW